MAHRDHVAGPGEHVRLAELDLAGDQLGGAQDEEERVGVLLELRALVGTQRVLDGEVVQAELRLDLLQERLARLVQPDPHEAIGGRQGRADVLDGHVGDPPAVGVGGAVDHHGRGANRVRHGCDTVAGPGGAVQQATACGG